METSKEIIKIIKRSEQQVRDMMHEFEVKREAAYVASQIIKNRKWHSIKYFARFLFTGKD